MLECLKRYIGCGPGVERIGFEFSIIVSKGEIENRKLSASRRNKGGRRKENGAVGIALYLGTDEKL